MRQISGLGSGWTICLPLHYHYMSFLGAILIHLIIVGHAGHCSSESSLRTAGVSKPYDPERSIIS